jgi:hypothetical protein
VLRGYSSIALGAFLVAVIQFVRVLLEYIDRKTKEMQEARSSRLSPADWGHVWGAGLQLERGRQSRGGA